MSAVQAQYYMMRAIELAAQARALARPNPRVGAVLVLNNEIVGEGYHHAYGHAHAEVEAIRSAGSRAQGATCYVTLEPCAHQGKTPPCIDALVAAKVKKVVMASLDPNPLVRGKGHAYLQAQGIDVEVGLCEAEAIALNPGFMQRMQYNKPYYVIKSAMSMDGKTAMQSGQSQWITGPASRERVHALRAEADAIVTGINSILNDDAMLTVRDDAIAHNPLFRQPKRFVLDSSLRIPVSAKIIKAPGQTFVITCSQDQEKIQALTQAGAQVFVQDQGEQVGLDFVERILMNEECHHILVEAGATLVGAYIAADKVDVWHIFTAPKLMGTQARALCAWENQDLASAKSFHLADIERVGEDLHCCYYPIKSERVVMFTGLIGSVGHIGSVTRGDLDICITVIMAADFAKGISLGDSIAVNGVCLTVARIEENAFTFYVSRESLLCTTFADVLHGDKVNLEKCLTLSTPIGGHMLTGHVHAAAQIRSIEAEGESWIFEAEVPRDLMKYMAAKGAVALDGVSLTINSVSKRCIFVNCIPHTMAHTNLSSKQVGDGLNLEIDLMIIYIDRLLTGENFGDVRLVSPDLISRALGVKITEH